MPAKNYLLAQTPDPFLDDPVAKVANTWADHFEVHDPDERSAFIDNYVQRCKEHRFWTLSEIVDGQRITLCRLGQIMLFTDGGVVNVKTITKSKDRSSFGAHRLPTRLLSVIPSKTPEGVNAIKMIRALKPAFGHKTPASQVFETMTTFSKEFRNLVEAELGKDINDEGCYFGNKTRDARYTTPRRRFYNCLGGATLKSFISHLNADVVYAIRGVRCPSLTLYNWIVSGSVERRIQAVRAFPLLLPYIVMANEKIDSSPTRSGLVNELGALVDGGHKLQGVMAQWLGCPERTVNVANAYPLHHTGAVFNQAKTYHWGEGLNTVLQSCGLGSRRPKNKAQWPVWTRLLQSIPQSLAQALRDKNQGWATFLAGCPEWDSPEWSSLTAKVLHLRDLKIFAGGWQPHYDWTLKRLLKLSEQWHAARNQVVNQLSKEYESSIDQNDYNWSMLFEGAITHPATSIEFVELTAPAHLYDEARHMQHCVDGYSDVCYSGDSRIISLRMNDQPLATAEFRLKRCEGEPSVAQLYCVQLCGPLNATIKPNSPAGKAFKWLLAQIKAYQIPVNLDWPDVPYGQRPPRMSDRQEQTRMRMQAWLLSKYGIVPDKPDFEECID